MTKIATYPFAIRKPSRSEKEEGGLIQSAYLNKYIRKGVLPEAILSKVYKDQGGIMDEEEKMLLILSELKLKDRMEQLKNITVNDKANKDLQESLLREIIQIRKDITSIYVRESSFFQETAESKAKNKLIQHYIGTLLYWKEKEGGGWTRYFDSDDIDTVLDKAEELEESSDEVYLKAKNHALYAISYLVTNGFYSKPEEIKEQVTLNGFDE